MFEIRSYHYDPEKFTAYKEWADLAVPYLRRELDLVGFWMDNGIAPEVSGAAPMDLPLGSANITWILRWDSKEHRDATFGSVMTSDEWQGIWDQHPDANGYLQMEARFADEA